MLTLSENNKNLGNLRLQQPKTFSVKILNNTDKDIKITEIKTGCGSCTSANVDGKSFVPAKSFVNLNIIFTPKSTGINRKTVTINGSLIFSFNANVT